MKSYVILVLAVVFDFLVANPVLKQAVVDKNSLLSESNDSNTNHEETPLNNSQIEQYNSQTNLNGESVILGERPKNDDILEIDIVEDTHSPTEQLINYEEVVDDQLGSQDLNNNVFNFQDFISTNIENEFELVQQGDYYYNDVIYKDPNEVMDTAAGFVPVPIFRKRQPSRNQFATRRYNRRPYASRRHYYFYPYYRFYRPSSLRYYY